MANAINLAIREVGHDDSVLSARSIRIGVRDVAIQSGTTTLRRANVRGSAATSSLFMVNEALARSREGVADIGCTRSV